MRVWWSRHFDFAQSINVAAAWTWWKGLGRHGKRLVLKIVALWHSFQMLSSTAHLPLPGSWVLYCNGGWTMGFTIGILWGKGCDTASALWTLLQRGWSSCICNFHPRGHRPATIWHADQYLDIWRRPALNLNHSETKKDFCTFFNKYRALKLCLII